MPPRCYCCDRVATTVEHVPPLCIFPERKDLPTGMDLRRNLITVPSCRTHNLKKSGDDEYLMYALVTNLPAGKIAFHHFSTKVLRAISRRPRLAQRILSQITPITVHDTQTQETFQTVAVQAEGERLEHVLRQVAFGIYRHHFAETWSGPIRVVPEFLRFVHERQSREWNISLQEASGYADQLFSTGQTYGENPSVFCYQVVQPAMPYHSVIRMHFYGGCKVLALFGEGNG